uniref:T-cell differentiation antigen CD6 n=1 Tax=Euleptes europaea TaxID=460621 RepID=UPI0025408703|nr:T-cell differentiation antigen CD6 [Euleptes europaea]
MEDFTTRNEDNTTAKPEAQRLRLVDGGSGCAGRVEFEDDGIWGTVCDDSWDLTDANVVCRQLGCGWAIQAPNASFFQKGTGPIHLDEVKCSGNESYLWDCPSEKKHDCGHKEDAGVVCSDHQEWRLSGGLDACAGRVEVYYEGVWNTVCDSSWYQQQANVLCRFLKCSNGAVGPKVPFDHTLLGKMYYDCSGNESSLAQCFWRYNNSNLCDQSRAAGLICLAVRENWEEKTPSYQMLLILCIILGLLLFMAILTLIVLLRRKDNTIARGISSASLTAPVLMNHSMPISGMTTGVNNDYREMPTSLPKGEATAAMITSHAEESDSDYEHYDFKDKPPTALSTFYNSLRHRAADTDISPCNIPMPAMQEEGLTTASRTLVNYKARTDSSDSSDYDDMWLSES